MASTKYKNIKYTFKDLERLRNRWKTEEGKERRRRIIQILQSGSTDLGDLTVFPDEKDKVAEEIPIGKDLRGINLASIEFPNGLNFTRFHFAGAILEAADFSLCNFSFCHLEYTSFNGSTLNRTIFKGAIMVKTTFVGSNLDMAIFAEAIVDGYQLIAHRTFMEDGFRDFSNKHGFIDKKPGFYNMIKQKYKELGRYDEMIPFHILEMRSKRDEKFIIEKEIIKNGKTILKRYKTPLWYIEKLFFDICFGYGEKWYRVFFTAISIVLLFSFLYMIEPLKSNWDPEVTTTNWIDTLYFSAVNFTNLGSQDWLPNGPLHRLFMSIESISGLFLITLIIVIFTRKMIRE
ncbi:MAG TPA: ion channel [Bacteroidota bacterium]|jgi:hypothetical protein|nr:ion channel [Bacteroidota bacterium]